MSHLDSLLDSIVSTAQVEHGVAPALLHARVRGRAAILARPQTQRRPRAEWMPHEDDFLRQQHGTLSEAEIGAALGRTPAAVHIRWKRELRLTPPRRNPQLLTAEHVAMGLGMDGKSIHRLMDTGLMPCRRLPSDLGGVCRVIERRVLLAWIVNPEHWCYFTPQRVGAKIPRGQRGFTSVYDESFWAPARRLVLLRLARWEDTWLTPGQVGRLLGKHTHLINREILAGRLPATRWGNWRIKRSAVHNATLRFDTRGQNRRADAFMVLASAVGLVPTEIAPLMAFTAKHVDHRLRYLRRTKKLKSIAQSAGVEYRRGVLFAPWRAHVQRFPRLARVMAAFAAHKRLQRSELGIVRGVLHAWAAWHARSRPQHQLEKRLRKFGGRHTPACFYQLYQTLRAIGLGDPLRAK